MRLVTVSISSAYWRSPSLRQVDAPAMGSRLALRDERRSAESSVPSRDGSISGGMTMNVSEILTRAPRTP